MFNSREDIFRQQSFLTNMQVVDKSLQFARIILVGFLHVWEYLINY